MASSSSLAEKLEDEVTCPVCFERFDHSSHLPKALPCFHTFCYLCISNMIAKTREETFPCPICKEATPSYEEPNKFKTNLTVSSMLDYIETEKNNPPGLTESKAGDPSSSERRATCKTHPNKTVSHVCTECWQVLCSKCLTSLLKSPTSSGHRHSVDEIEDAMDQARHELKVNAAEITKSLEKSKKFDAECETWLAKEKQKVKEQVRLEVDRRIQQLGNDRHRINIAIDKFYQSDEKRKEDMDAMASHLNKLLSGTQTALQKNSDAFSFMVLRKCRQYRKQNGTYAVVSKTHKLQSCKFQPNTDPVPKDAIGSLVKTSVLRQDPASASTTSTLTTSSSSSSSSPQSPRPSSFRDYLRLRDQGVRRSASYSAPSTSAPTVAAWNALNSNANKSNGCVRVRDIVHKVFCKTQAAATAAATTAAASTGRPSTSGSAGSAGSACGTSASAYRSGSSSATTACARTSSAPGPSRPRTEEPLRQTIRLCFSNLDSVSPTKRRRTDH